MVVGLGTLLAMLGPALVRRHVDVKRLAANNEIAGFKFATIGVLYAVLLAFAIIVVWGKFSDAEVDVVQEAAENLYRLSQGLDDNTHFIEGAVLKLHGGTEGLEPQVRRIFSEVDPNLTVQNIQTMQQRVDANLDQQRAIAQLTGLFGILALVLAAVGLYGVTAYAVEKRTGEIGVRMALGADRRNVIALVLRGAFSQIVIGLLIGVPVSIACARLIAAQLYHVKGWDPLVLFGAILSLGLCAFLASVVPAKRAASIDPVQALRAE